MLMTYVEFMFDQNLFFVQERAKNQKKLFCLQNCFFVCKMKSQKFTHLELNESTFHIQTINYRHKSIRTDANKSRI